MRRRTSEVALGAVPVHRNIQTPGGRLRVVLAVCLESVDKAIRGIIGLVEVLRLNLRRLLKCFSGIDVCDRPMLVGCIDGMGGRWRGYSASAS